MRKFLIAGILVLSCATTGIGQDSLNVSCVGILPYWNFSNDFANDLALDGNYAYIFISELGLFIVDISDPENPFETGWLAINEIYTGIAASEGYVYLTFWDGLTLNIVDATDPYHPQMYDTLILPGADSWRLKKRGDYLFAAPYGGSFYSLDISDPAHPVIIDNVGTICTQDLYLEGNRAYCTYYDAVVIDMTNPENLSILGVHDLNGISRSVVVNGDTAYFHLEDNSDHYFLLTYDVSLPSHFTQIANFYTGVASFTLCEIEDNILFTSNMDFILDMTNPYNPHYLYYWEDLSGPQVIVEETHFILNWDLGLTIVEDSVISNPEIIGNYERFGDLRSVCVDGDYAYLMTFDNSPSSYDNMSIQIVEISDPGNPQPFNEIQINEANNYPSWMKKYNDFIYLRCYGGIKIFQIMAGGSLVLVDSLSEYYQNVDFFENYAVFADGNAGIDIYDISNPAGGINQVSDLHDIGDIQGTAIYGNYIYAYSCNPTFINICDISNITNPTLIDTFDIAFYAYRLAAQNGFLHILSGSDYYLYDLSNPLNPECINSYDLPMGSGDMEIYDNYVFLTRQVGIHILDYSDPLELQLTGFHPAFEYTYDIALQGNYIYSVEGWRFLQIFDISQAMSVKKTDVNIIPDKFQLQPVYPNPFNPSTTIRFVLPQAGNVSLTIYDLAGREVAKLIYGFQTAGTHSIAFDGSDLASGIYFARLSAGDFTQVQKLLLLK